MTDDCNAVLDLEHLEFRNLLSIHISLYALITPTARANNEQLYRI